MLDECSRRRLQRISMGLEKVANVQVAPLTWSRDCLARLRTSITRLATSLGRVVRCESKS